MSQVVDMNSARAQKAAAEAQEEVTLIACVGCQSVGFHLAPEGGVICAGCHQPIRALRWYDADQPTTA